MTATGPGTTMGRIAELEAAVAALRERLDALEAKPPVRDPASTTAAVTAIATPPAASARRREFGPAFGFTSQTGDAHG